MLKNSLVHATLSLAYNSWKSRCNTFRMLTQQSAFTQQNGEERCVDKLFIFRHKLWNLIMIVQQIW